MKSNNPMEIANNIVKDEIQDNIKINGNKKTQCSLCGQKFRFIKALQKHEARHQGEGGFICRTCGMHFTTAEAREKHRDKEHKICNKGFCHRQSLITHSTLHTGIKPYQCEGCGNSFSCVGNLLKHRKTHAETCGKIPLTTHRVKHPVTKLKVQVNTPPTIKLKTIEKRKKIEKVTLEHVQNSKSWQDTNSSEENIENDDKIIEESKNNICLNGYAFSDVNFSTEEEKIDSKYDENIALANICIKNENWFPPMNSNTNEKFFNEDDHLNKSSFFNGKNEVEEIKFIPINKVSQLKNNKSTNQIQDEESKDENLLEINSNFVKKQSESDNECLNETDTISYRNSDSEKSDDSLDLDTRKLKLDQKKKEQKRKLRNRERAVDRKKIKEFIKERGFNENGLNCKYCGNHYTVPLWLLKHELKHEQDGKVNSVKCGCCNKLFETKKECVTHQQTEHRNELNCQECDKLFANPDSLKAHINVHHKGVPRKKYVYICDKCGKVFKQKALLITHEQSNCGDGPIYKCNVCEKPFTSKHVLKSHMRVHLPEKSLLCKFCGKSFHWKGQLKIHERSHTGERPFKCQHCPKAFAYRESLITHTTLHTGIKPHLCENCGSRFSCIGNLLKHRRTHASTCGMITQVKTEVLIV